MGAISPEGCFWPDNGRYWSGQCRDIHCPGAVARATSGKKIAGAGSGCQYWLFRAICGVAGNTIFHQRLWLGDGAYPVIRRPDAGSLSGSAFQRRKADSFHADLQAERKKCADHCAWQPRLYFAHYRLFCRDLIVFIGTHLPTYLRDAGLSSEVASWSLAVVGPVNIIGFLRLHVLCQEKAVSPVYLGRSIFMVIYHPALDAADGYFIRLYYGLLAGDHPLTSGLIVVFFGPAFLSMLYGIAFLSHQVTLLSGHGWADAFICWAAMR